MNEILINFLTKVCFRMKEPTSKCSKKGKCDGSCALFVNALNELEWQSEQK